MVDVSTVVRDHGYHPLTVVEVVEDTPDTRSYVLGIPDELADVFRYRAGQFCTFRVEIGDDVHLRCYSMSSAPDSGRDLTVTVKRVSGGVISNWFHDHVRTGSRLEVSRPAGVFCVQEGERPLIACCGGSGVTPVMSIARSVLATTDRSIDVLYANRDRSSIIFHDELRDLETRYPGRLNVTHHLDRDAGYLDRTAIESFVAGRTDADFYICGPTPFMDLVETTLQRTDVAPERIAIERFGTPPPPAAPPDEPEPAGSESEPSVPESVTVIMNRKRTAVRYRPGDTVLETARRGGLQPPFSCEAGNCATCMALVHEGSITMRVNNALTADEVASGWVLTCQAIPTGDSLTVEYETF